jgi:hypothetical protein
MSEGTMLDTGYWMLDFDSCKTIRNYELSHPGDLASVPQFGYRRAPNDPEQTAEV